MKKKKQLKVEGRENEKKEMKFQGIGLNTFIVRLMMYPWLKRDDQG